MRHAELGAAAAAPRAGSEEAPIFAATCSQLQYAFHHSPMLCAQLVLQSVLLESPGLYECDFHLCAEDSDLHLCAGDGLFLRFNQCCNKPGP